MLVTREDHECLILVVLLSATVNCLQQSDILFVILSQETPYHVKKAENLEKLIRDQFNENEIAPTIHLTHRHHNVVGSWTIFPVISRIKDHSFKWLFVCEDVTRVNVTNLVKILTRYSHLKDVFIGHALQDIQPTIIHHFEFQESSHAFQYPSFASGFVISRSLVHKISLFKVTVQFSIDPKYELAKFIWEKGGVRLIDVREFSVGLEQCNECATFISEAFSNCGGNIPDDDFMIAVKTYSKFYDNRVQIVLSTWRPYVKNVIFFGDLHNSSIPVKSIGVQNTQNGHCQKTLNILKYVAETQSNFKWLVVVDDDTILGISRLRQFLYCYDDHLKISLGERYGFNTASGNGYSYVTGGGGMVFSMEAVKALTNKNSCQCPDIDSPDDMILGVCLQQLYIPIIHSGSFHQARPDDYSPEYLRSRRPLSFHKHWMIDPVSVYNNYFKYEDELLQQQNTVHHNEL